MWMKLINVAHCSTCIHVCVFPNAANTALILGHSYQIQLCCHFKEMLLDLGTAARFHQMCTSPTIEPWV